MNNGIEPMLTNSISAVNTDKKSKKNNLVFIFNGSNLFNLSTNIIYIFFNLSFHKIEVFEFQLNQTVFLIHYNIFYQNKLSQ